MNHEPMDNVRAFADAKNPELSCDMFQSCRTGRTAVQ